MKQTSPAWLVAAGACVAIASAILTWGFYGSMVSVSTTASLTLWVMSVVCVVLGRRVRAHVDERTIGLDRSQLNPVTAALWLVIGKASAWTGALVAGAYIGMASYVLTKMSILVAAQADAPGVIASALSGVALAAAGVYLERGCALPPPTDGEPA